jgi:hypothetical protein
MAFALENPITMKPYIDESIYKPEVNKLRFIF